MGLLVAPPEKKPKLTASAAIAVHSLRSLLEANSTRNGQVSRISARRKAYFLRSPDWVAEGSGFETLSTNFDCGSSDLSRVIASFIASSHPPETALPHLTALKGPLRD
jgi:hypothetical protein